MTIRAFFAIDISEEEIVKKIHKLQKELEISTAKINFVDPNDLHLTLKFLGNIEETILHELQGAAKKISFPIFDLELKGMGCLPSYSYINAIYIGITKGLEQLAFLAKALEKLNTTFHFKREDREYKAHLTIGRLKAIQNKNQLVEKIKAQETTHFGNIEITKFTLKQSELTPQGPIYTTLFEVAGSK